MSVLILMLQCQFVYVRTKGVEEEKEEMLSWQKEGIWIGSSSSGPIAGITVLVGEIMMGKKMDIEEYN